MPSVLKTRSLTVAFLPKFQMITYLKDLLFQDSDKKNISELTSQIQNLIEELYSKQPANKTFEQEGFLNGSQIVQEYLDEQEYALAIEHLLYMVHESDVVYPNEVIEKLNELTLKYKIENPYQEKVL